MQNASTNPHSETLQPEDGVLVGKAKAGDLDAFEMLVFRYERMVYSLALRMLQNEHDAEDITQQTFISAMTALAGFREESGFATWLMRIATHAALKVIRKRHTIPFSSLDEATEPQEENEGIRHPEFIADWEQSPENLLQKKETSTQIEEAFSKLDENHRLVFLLRDVEELSVKETAQLLGISESNVKVRLLRARLQLRELLTRAFGDPSTRIERTTHAH